MLEPPKHVCRLWQSIKVLHILCDILMTAVGAVGLVVTILARTQAIDELFLMYNYQNVIVEVIFGCSILLIIIGLGGIYAAVKTSYPELVASATLTSAFLLGTLAYAFYEGFTRDYGKRGHLYHMLDLEMKHYNRHPEIVDTLQTTLSCCGVNGFEDWIRENITIPQSCCPGVIVCDVDSQYLQPRGCFRSLVKLAGYYAWTVLVGLGFLYFNQTLAIILSYLLYRKSLEDKKKRQAIEDADLKIPRVPNIGKSENTNEASTSDQEKTTEEVIAEEPKAAESELEPVAEEKEI